MNVSRFLCFWFDRCTTRAVGRVPVMQVPFCSVCPACPMALCVTHGANRTWERRNRTHDVSGTIS